MANVCVPPERVAELKEQLLHHQLDANEIAKLLPDERQAVKAILEDFVTDKLNIKASSEEIKAIQIKAQRIDEAQQKLADNLGDPSKLDDNLEFFKAKKDMDEYLQSHNPAPKTRVVTGTIGRGMMLASVKSPILNIGSNLEIGATEALGRRIAAGSIHGTDPKLARDYIKMVNKVYQETGYDVSRMLTIDDTGVNGGRVLDEAVHSYGPGAVRKAGHVVEDVVFKQMMGAPDVASASIHFADSVNLNALKAAHGDLNVAREWMQDAMRLNPMTDEGKLLRGQAILDAQYATWTNKSWASQVSTGVRKILNDLSGNLRLGDYLFPFVKTPANVISTGVDYAGMGIPKALFTAVKGIRTGTLRDEQTIRDISRNLTRAGMGLTGAAILAANIDSNNFIGAYDPNRAQFTQLQGSNFNAVKIGNKWISTDWFGPLSVPLTSMLYAKKYGNNGKEQVWQYGKGIQSSVLNLPGVKDVADYFQTQNYKKNQTADEASAEAGIYVTDQLSSRLMPSIVGDVAKATDSKERKAEKGIQGVQAKIPGLREKLPVKHDIFGREVKTQGPGSVILFGSRVKTDRQNATIKEIARVSDANGKNITFTDWDKATNKDLGNFKRQVGLKKYNDAKVAYGKTLEKKLTSDMRQGQYKKLDELDKMKVINDADAWALKETLKQYHYKKPRTERSNLLKSFR